MREVWLVMAPGETLRMGAAPSEFLSHTHGWERIFWGWTIPEEMLPGEWTPFIREPIFA